MPDMEDYEMENEEEEREEMDLAPDVEDKMMSLMSDMDEGDAVEMAEKKEMISEDDMGEDLDEDDIKMLFGSGVSERELDRVKNLDKPKSLLERAKKNLLNK